LKALESGSSTQADLAKQTKVKNTYQVITDLVKKGLVSKVNGVVILNKSKLPIAIDETKVVPNEHVDRIAMLKDEIDNINDGIRALMMTRSYLLRRAEEESRRA
jgi:hypothetical protein